MIDSLVATTTVLLVSIVVAAYLLLRKIRSLSLRRNDNPFICDTRHDHVTRYAYIGIPRKYAGGNVGDPVSRDRLRLNVPAGHDVCICKAGACVFKGGHRHCPLAYVANANHSNPVITVPFVLLPAFSEYRATELYAFILPMDPCPDELKDDLNNPARGGDNGRGEGYFLDCRHA